MPRPDFNQRWASSAPSSNDTGRASYERPARATFQRVAIAADYTAVSFMGGWSRSHSIRNSASDL